MKYGCEESKSPQWYTASNDPPAEDGRATCSQIALCPNCSHTCSPTPIVSSVTVSSLPGSTGADTRAPVAGAALGGRNCGAATASGETASANSKRMVNVM